MNRIRVLLAIGPRLLRESLRHEIQSQLDMAAMTSAASTLPELLVEVKRTRADAVVISADQTGEVPGICTHFFAEFPEIVVVALVAGGNQAFCYRQDISVEEICEVSTGDLVSTLRTANTGYWIPE